MLRNIEKRTDYFVQKPRNLFLLDGSGALFTCLSLFLIQRYFSADFGMPVLYLRSLFVLALCMCIYSLSCFLFLKNKQALFIRIISAANLLYCMLTLVFMSISGSGLTLAGAVWFSGEMVIICSLAFFELRIARRISAAWK